MVSCLQMFVANILHHQPTLLLHILQIYEDGWLGVLAQNRFQFKFPVRNNKNTNLMPNAIFYSTSQSQDPSMQRTDGETKHN